MTKFLELPYRHNYHHSLGSPRKEQMIDGIILLRAALK